MEFDEERVALGVEVIGGGGKDALDVWASGEVAGVDGVAVAEEEGHFFEDDAGGVLEDVDGHVGAAAVVCRPADLLEGEGVFAAYASDVVIGVFSGEAVLVQLGFDGVKNLVHDLVYLTG